MTHNKFGAPAIGGCAGLQTTQCAGVRSAKGVWCAKVVRRFQYLAKWSQHIAVEGKAELRASLHDRGRAIFDVCVLVARARCYRKFGNPNGESFMRHTVAACSRVGFGRTAELPSPRLQPHNRRARCGYFTLGGMVHASNVCNTLSPLVFSNARLNPEKKL